MIRFAVLLLALWWYVVGSIKSIKWWRDLDISKTHTGLYLVKKKNCNTDWHICMRPHVKVGVLQKNAINAFRCLTQERDSAGKVIFSSNET